MDNDIIVSVIIPTYNRGKTIADSILSITSQSMDKIEVLVIDDGSTDSTERVVEELAAKDTRIKYLKQKNGGANKARNLGISLAEGKYIAFNDSDDIWRKDKLEKELVFLRDHKEYIGVFSKFKLHYVNENKMLVAPKKVRQPLYDQLLQANVVNTPNLIIEKNIIQEFDGFNEVLRRFQDWELAIKVAKKYRLYFLDEILVDTYQYGSGHLSNNMATAIESYKLIEQEFEEDRNKNNYVKCNFYYYMIFFLFGTKEFKPTLFRNIKLCNYHPKLILKIIVKFIQLFLLSRKRNR